MRYITLILILIAGCASQSPIDFLVQPSGITPDSIGSSLDLAGLYLLDSVEDSGKMDYLYLPDNGTYPDENNMIRQFMATYALLRLYHETGDMRYRTAYEKNLRFNFREYYVYEEGFGYVQHNDVAKLGSSAIALMALQDAGEDYDVKRDELESFLYLMQDEDGSFRTYYLPPGAVGNENYYPGEAMLSLMLAYKRSGNESTLDRVEMASPVYQDWFRNSPNPAFVPWQTIAHYLLYKTTEDDSYRDFIFEMNDWLILFEDTSCSPDPHARGRFYDPAHPDYGPPHASSTGVYVESLAYAYELAKEAGDQERVDSYGKAIILGLRSLMQLQITEQNMEGVIDFQSAIGGIMTSMDRKEIRIDNVQHAVMAMLTVREFMSADEIARLTGLIPDCAN